MAANRWRMSDEVSSEVMLRDGVHIDRFFVRPGGG